MKTHLLNSSATALFSRRLIKSILNTNRLPLLASLLLALSVNTRALSQTTGCHCTSNDVESVRIFLSSDTNGTPLTNTDCEAGTNYTAYVTFDFKLNAAQRPGAFAEVTYSRNGATPQTIEQCFAVVYSGTNAKLSLQIPDYVCGDQIQIASAIFAWGQGSNQNHANSFCQNGFNVCRDFEPKCYQITNTITVDGPVISNFNFLKSCDGIGNGLAESITLTGNATGGTGPYTFDWDLNNDGTYDVLNSVSISPSLAVGDYTITMRATDSKGATDVHTLEIPVNVCVSLPVTYTYIKAFNAGEGKNTIEWQTVLESDHAYFQVEKSNDARRFEALGQPITQPVSVNAQFKTYQTTDQNPGGGNTYYRIRQVDADGTTNLSPIIATTREAGANLLVISPNPVRDILKVELATERTGEYTIELFDATGRKRATTEGVKREAKLTDQINTSLLGGGIYYLTVRVQDEYFFKRLIK